MKIYQMPKLMNKTVLKDKKESKLKKQIIRNRMKQMTKARATRKMFKSKKIQWKRKKNKFRRKKLMPWETRVYHSNMPKTKTSQKSTWKLMKKELRKRLLKKGRGLSKIPKNMTSWKNHLRRPGKSLKINWLQPVLQLIWGIQKNFKIRLT